MSQKQPKLAKDNAKAPLVAKFQFFGTTNAVQNGTFRVMSSLIWGAPHLVLGLYGPLHGR